MSEEAERVAEVAEHIRQYAHESADEHAKERATEEAQEAARQAYEEVYAEVYAETYKEEYEEAFNDAYGAHREELLNAMAPQIEKTRKRLAAMSWQQIGTVAQRVVESCGADIRDHQRKMQAELNRQKED